MKKNYIDKIVAEKLQQLQPSMEDGWDVFAEKLAKAEALDDVEQATAQFDEATKSKLTDYEVPYNKAHWFAMATRLDEEFRIIPKLIRAKAIEMILMSLLFTSFIHFLPIHQPFKPLQANLPKQVAPTPNVETKHPAIEQSPQTAKKTPPQIVVESEEIVFTTDKESIASTVVTTADSKSTLETTMTSIEGLRLASLYENKFKLNTTDFVLPIQFESLWLMPKIVDSINRTKALAVNDLPTIEINGDLTLTNEEDTPTIAAIETKKGLEWRFGMFGNSELNYIRTPFDIVFQQKPYAQLSSGYGGGFSLGASWDRWEIETGAIYSAKNYTPPPIKYFFEGSVKEGGYVGETLRDIELDLLHIPLNARYNFISKDRWRVYALTGLSAHIALQANYYRQKIVVGRSQSLTGVVKNNTGLEEVKRFENGWLEGGSFKENSYFTANLGFGVERYFAYRWSIFTQPVLQYHIKGLNEGIGPNHDLINGMYISTGIKIGLNK